MTCQSFCLWESLFQRLQAPFWGNWLVFVQLLLPSACSQQSAARKRLQVHSCSCWLLLRGQQCLRKTPRHFHRQTWRIYPSEAPTSSCEARNDKRDNGCWLRRWLTRTIAQLGRTTGSVWWGWHRNGRRIVSSGVCRVSFASKVALYSRGRPLLFEQPATTERSQQKPFLARACGYSKRVEKYTKLLWLIIILCFLTILTSGVRTITRYKTWTRTSSLSFYVSMKHRCSASVQTHFPVMSYYASPDDPYIKKRFKNSIILWWNLLDHL